MNGQMAVADAGVNSSLQVNNTIQQQNYLKNSAILTKTVSTLNTLQQMKQQYDEWEENIEEVNNKIETGKQVVKTVESLKDITVTYEEAIGYIAAEPMINPAEKDKFINAFSKIVDKALDDFDEALDVSTSGSYKMTDAERMTMLNDILKRIQHNKNLMEYFLKKIKKSVSVQKGKKQQKEFIENSVNSFKE